MLFAFAVLIEEMSIRRIEPIFLASKSRLERVSTCNLTSSLFTLTFYLPKILRKSERGKELVKSE